RAGGTTWHELVACEERPLVADAVSHALDELGAASGRFRREEARALHREDVSITRIGKLLGVSRQRASAILSEPR
ncbi:hypothetical protein, partial [Pseudonocardia pini]|uniref:hypothetical protein n=1 Tax=Pseudonocardia pini TaxID=2758030 RepID=UPI001C691DA3